MTGGLLGRAASDVIGAPRLWAIGLAGFLAGGGIVLFGLPIVVLPSVVGMSTFIGPNAVTAAGPSSRFVGLIVGGSILIGAWIVLGTLVSVAAERALVRAIIRSGIGRGEGPGGGPSGSPGDDPRLVRLFAIRLVSLVPFGLAVGVGAARLGQVGYQELILPSDSAEPFVLRVLLSAPEVVVLLALGWLISEAVGALGIRLAMIGGTGVVRSIRGSIVWIARRPLLSVGLLGATVIVGGLVILPALAISVTAWSDARNALLGGASPPTTALAVVVFVAVWAAGLGLAGIVAAWRSAAWSLAVMGDHRVGGLTTHPSGTL